MGVNIYAQDSDIKTAYRNLVKLYHPDVTGSQDATYYNLIVEAYEYLCENPLNTVPVGGRVIGSTPKKRDRGNEYAAFNAKYEKKKEADKREFEHNMEEFTRQKNREEAEYRRAMDAINAIRVAEAIKAYLADRT